MEILFKVLEKMPQTFSSNHFNIVARKYGDFEYQIRNGILLKFLIDNCNRLGTKRMFSKINHPTPTLNFNNDIIGGITKDLSQNNTDMFPLVTEKYCIDRLKSKGYKIFKSEFIEI